MSSFALSLVPRSALPSPVLVSIKWHFVRRAGKSEEAKNVAEARQRWEKTHLTEKFTCDELREEQARRNFVNSAALRREIMKNLLPLLPVLILVIY
jgi:hypothetical protein